MNYAQPLSETLGFPGLTLSLHLHPLIHGLDQRHEASDHALQAMLFSIPGCKGRVNSMVAP
jgi:hypothetical protein